MLKRKNIIKVAIDSPAAAGAGTQAKLISKHYNLLQLDTGRIYRYIANIKIVEPRKFNYHYLKKKIIIKNYLKDHRVFMTSVIAALSFGGEWKIHDKDSIKTSFPNFLEIINNLKKNVKKKKYN